MPRTRTLPDEQLLEMVLALIHAEGPDAASFGAVAKVSGLSGSTLVQRFGTKAGMLRAALLHAWDRLDAEARGAIERDGAWMRPSEYGDAYPITRGLIEDGRRWGILGGPVGIKVPVRILQGGQDPDVPWRHALELAGLIEAEDLVFTLVRDGDHRLSRPQDIARLIRAVAELV